MLGKDIFGYYVTEKIGEGSFSSVYKLVKTNASGTYVRALKHISFPEKKQYNGVLDSMGGDYGKADDYFANMLQDVVNEIRIISELSESGNKNFVRYYDNDIQEFENPKRYNVFIMMEHLVSFSDYVQENRFSVGDVIRLGKEILNALMCCHERNIIHRDIKDDNLFVAADGTFKLGDFGVSKVLLDKTYAASVKGTPSFIAPEVYLGNTHYDHTVDLYSLGIVLYRLLNMSRNPFLPAFPSRYTTEDENKAFQDRMLGKKPDLPIMAQNILGETVVKAILPRQERYNSAQEFLTALEEVEGVLEAAELEKDIGLFRVNECNPFKRRDGMIMPSGSEGENHNVNGDEKTLPWFVHAEEDAHMDSLAMKHVSHDGKQKKRLVLSLVGAISGLILIAVLVMLLLRGCGSDGKRPEESPSVDETTDVSPQETEDIHTHTIIVDPLVEATCIQTGLSEGKHCSTCGEILVEQIVLPIIAHEYDDDKDIDCNICGSQRDLTCKHENRNTTIGTKPTCSEAGISDGEVCADCGEILVSQIELKPIAHNYVEWVCTECGYSYSSQGLAFSSNGDGTCSVIGLGTCVDLHIVLPVSSPEGDLVTSIAKGAFETGVGLESIYIRKNVTHLDSEVLFPFGQIWIYAANQELVKAAIQSGAEDIWIEVSGEPSDYEGMVVCVPETVRSFTLVGKDLEYRGVTIESRAEKTSLRHMKLSGNNSSPLLLYSSDILLDHVEVKNVPGFALMLYAAETRLALNGTVALHSDNGHTMISKDMVLSKELIDGQAKLVVDGQYYLCGDLQDQNLLSVVHDKEIINIDEEAFNGMTSIHTIVLDYHNNEEDGVLSNVYYGQNYGALPIPTRENYTFSGWYTEEKGGSKILSSTVVENYKAHTLHAQWTPNSFTVSFDLNGGKGAVQDKTLIFGEQYGELISPIRDHYIFDGWYTALSGGQKISSNTVPTAAANVTLYAHWTLKTYQVNWQNPKGCQVVVNRLSSPNAQASIGPLNNGASVYYGDTLSVQYITETGYSIVNKGGEKITVAGNVGSAEIHATTSVKMYTVNWKTGAGYTISVKRVSSPLKGASTGAITNGGLIYHGDVLTIDYIANTGYTLTGKGSESLTVTANVTSSNVFATAQVNTYTARWNTGVGYTISVERVSSPLAGASSGVIANGATVYHGDALYITYTPHAGYSLTSTGPTSVAVAGNDTADYIYATAAANSYTYTVVYKSSNGTPLGTSSCTYKYGTTNTVHAPAKTGYKAPASQSVKWDSTSDKTITFIYTPIAVENTTKTGQIYREGSSILNYSAKFEYRNRTATSVEVRVVWTSTLLSGWNECRQRFTVTIGSQKRGPFDVVDIFQWSQSVNYARSAERASDWITVPLSTTEATSVNVGVYFFQADYNYTDLSNTQASLNKTWAVNIPAY